MSKEASDIITATPAETQADCERRNNISGDFICAARGDGSRINAAAA